MATVAWPPFVMPKSDDSQAAKPKSLMSSSRGIEMDMFDSVASHANFTPVVM
jgi:hypothetical protein